MKKNVFLNAITGFGLALSLSLTVLPSTAADHHDHDHDAYSIELQLNNGQKWETDAPLRQAMGDISIAVNAALDGIHHNRLDAAGYDKIVTTVHQQVAHMVANCELEPAADAQLHIVIARLLSSVQEIEQSADLKVKNAAAVKIVGTLISYADYFEDADFVKPAH